MAAVPRSIWVDDSGSGTDGTILANSELQKIYDNVDAETKSTNFVSIATKSIIDSWMAAGGFYFGGSISFRRNTAIPSGSTYDLLAPGTGVWNIDSAWLPGSWRWEALLDAEVAGTVTVSACLVNLDDDPNNAITNSLITTSVVTGSLVRSGVLSFAVAGVAKKYGVKVWTNNAAIGARVKWARALRTA
jgi:hypothetical protein